MKDGVVAPQSCHGQAGGTHRGSTGWMPVLPHQQDTCWEVLMQKDLGSETQRAPQVDLCSVGAAHRHRSNPAASCPSISLISIPSPSLLLPL